MKPTFQLKLLDKRARFFRGTDGAAGYDVVACIDEPITIRRYEHAVLIPTGLAISIGDPNVAAMILPRSGLGHKQGLILGNTVGLIDSDYQNQWFVSAWNRGQQEEIVIKPEERIAQVVFVPVIHPYLKLVQQFEDTTERGLGGFGSTGK